MGKCKLSCQKITKQSLFADLNLAQTQMGQADLVLDHPAFGRLRYDLDPGLQSKQTSKSYPESRVQQSKLDINVGQHRVGEERRGTNRNHSEQHHATPIVGKREQMHSKLIIVINCLKREALESIYSSTREKTNLYIELYSTLELIYAVGCKPMAQIKKLQIKKMPN